MTAIHSLDVGCDCLTLLLPKTLFPGTQEEITSLAHLSEAACKSSSSKEEKSEIFRRDDIDEEQRIYFQVQIKDEGGSQNYIFWAVPHFSF